MFKTTSFQIPLGKSLYSCLQNDEQQGDFCWSGMKWIKIKQKDDLCLRISEAQEVENFAKLFRLEGIEKQFMQVAENS